MGFSIRVIYSYLIVGFWYDEFITHLDDYVKNYDVQVRSYDDVYDKYYDVFFVLKDCDVSC